VSGATSGTDVIASGSSRVGRPPGETADDDSPTDRLRNPAVLGVVLATLSYLSVFYHVTDVVGGVVPLVAEVVIAAGVGLVAATRLRERVAVGVAVVGFAAALGVYVASVPESQRALFTVGRLAQDLLALSSGLSVLRLINAGTWALSLAPVPTFVVAYLAGRGRHVWAATVAAATTGFFVLTSDAGVAAALAGAVGATTAVGLAGLAGAGRRGLVAQWDTVVVIVTAMVLVTSLVTVVPGGGNTVVPGGSPSVESSLVSNNDRVSVLGSITLSPSVRFTVESDQPAYWAPTTGTPAAGGSGRATPLRTATGRTGHRVRRSSSNSRTPSGRSLTRSRPRTRRSRSPAKRSR